MRSGRLADGLRTSSRAQDPQTLTPRMDPGFFPIPFLASPKYLTVTVIEKIIPFSHNMYYPRPTFFVPFFFLFS